MKHFTSTFALNSFGKVTTLLFFMVVCATTLLAQFDSRIIPHYLNPEYQENMYLRKPGLWVMAPSYPPEAFKPRTTLLESITTPDGFPLMNASPFNLDQTETWISVNPKDPRNIIAGSNDMLYNGSSGYRMTAFVTTDGGASWRRTLLPDNSTLGKPTQGGATNFDPAICYDADGNCYYGYGWARIIGDGSGDNGDNFILVSKSTDKGTTWTNSTVSSWENVSDRPFDDKWLMAADNTASSPRKNNVYISWTRFGTASFPGGIMFARSTDKGESWLINDEPLDVGGIQSSCPAVGPDGTVYVTWRKGSSNSTQAIVRRSTNGGESFQPLVLAQSVGNLGTVNSQNGRNELTTKQRMRINSAPVIDVDKSSGQYSGRVYICQAGKVNNISGVWLTYSTDKGQTWTNSIRLDNNTRNNDCFFPAISVDPITGLISVFYYSSQNSADNTGVDGYLSVSSNGGQSWTQLRLTPTTIRFVNGGTVSAQAGNGGFYWGDYSGNACYNGISYPCFWIPDAATNFSMSSNDAYVGIVSSGPRPVTSLAVTNTFQAPTSAVLTWTDPTTTTFNQPIGEFTVILQRDGVDVGTIAKGTQTYTDNSLVDGTTYVYSVKVRQSTGMESVIATIELTAGGALKPKMPTDIVAKPVSGGIKIYWKSPAQHVDNSVFHDFQRIYFYNNKTLVDSVDADGSIVASGVSSSKILTLPLQKFYGLRLRAAGIRGNIRTLSDESDSVYSYSGSPRLALSDGFDSNDSLAYTNSSQTNTGTPGSPNPPLWGRTTIKAKSAPNSLTDSPVGSYRANTTSTINLAPIVVENGLTSLSFESICLINRNSSQHFGLIEYSNDFCQTWKTIQSGGSFQRLADDDNKTVQEADWRTISRTFVGPSMASIGDTVYLRFSVRGGPTSTQDGWYIDDIRMDGNPNSVETDAVYSSNSVVAEPNPATNTITFSYLLHSTGAVSFDVFDVYGKIVQTFQSDNTVPGVHKVSTDVSTLTNGMYFCRMQGHRTMSTTTFIIAR